LYVVSKCDPGGWCFTLTNAEMRAEPLISLCCGGQLAEFEADVVCSLPRVMLAVEEFFAEHEQISSLWRPEQMFSRRFHLQTASLILRTDGYCPARQVSDAQGP